MAIKPPAVGVAKVTFHFLCSGRSYSDSLFIGHINNTPWTTVDLKGLADFASAAWTSTLKSLTSPLCSLTSVETLDLSDTVGRSAVNSSVVVGSSAGTEPLPLNCVAHISFEVARRYRGGKPGFNVSGLDRNMMSDDRLFNVNDAQTILNSVKLLVSDTLAAFAGLIQQVGVSYTDHKVPRIIPLVLPIIDAEIQQRLCTLRKRLGKGV